MTSDKRWLLPDGIDELLPERAAAVEQLRRALLDDCANWGYQYVIPPLVEFTDSLLVGLGADLDVITCKFADRLSGRTLGVRADMTPQAARIDAHSLGAEGVTRLCYAGSTLHSAPQSVMASRSPIQLGAEIYGCSDISADLEVIDLMLALLARADVAERHRPVTLDIGHVGIYEAVLAQAGLTGEQSDAVFDALQRKSGPDLAAVLGDLSPPLAATLNALAVLHGAPDILADAKILLKDIPTAVAALDQVSQVIAAVQRAHPEVSIYVDLAELRGFRYHTGLVFAAYLEGMGAAVAKGGRYDNVGAVFGRERAATGFACDLKGLAELSTGGGETASIVSAPLINDADLAQTVSYLRSNGRTVITALNGEHDPRCTEQLIKQGDGWVCQPLL